jgi:hypothetical protein
MACRQSVKTKMESIAANVARSKNVDVRIFPFGFGYDVNTALLDKIGTDNGGISDYVQPKEDLEVKVSNFFARVSSPFFPISSSILARYKRKMFIRERSAIFSRVCKR